MKKICCLLVFLLSFCLVSASFATPFYLEVAGVTVDLPEGMVAEDMSNEDSYVLAMAVEGREDLVYAYVLVYKEELADRWTEDLTEEEAIAFGEALATTIDNPEIEVIEMEGLLYIAAANAAHNEAHLFSIENGWVTDIAVVNTLGNELTQDEITILGVILTSISYDE